MHSNRWTAVVAYVALSKLALVPLVSRELLGGSSGPAAQRITLAALAVALEMLYRRSRLHIGWALMSPALPCLVFALVLLHSTTQSPPPDTEFGRLADVALATVFYVVQFIVIDIGIVLVKAARMIWNGAVAERIVGQPPQDVTDSVEVSGSGDAVMNGEGRAQRLAWATAAALTAGPVTVFVVMKQILR